MSDVFFSGLWGHRKPIKNSCTRPSHRSHSPWKVQQCRKTKALTKAIPHPSALTSQLTRTYNRNVIIINDLGKTPHFDWSPVTPILSIRTSPSIGPQRNRYTDDTSEWMKTYFNPTESSPTGSRRFFLLVSVVLKPSGSQRRLFSWRRFRAATIPAPRKASIPTPPRTK